MPIWSGQVHLMRTLTEESITALANRFAAAEYEITDRNQTRAEGE